MRYSGSIVTARGVSATMWPMLTAASAAVADLAPLAPAAACATYALSDVVPFVEEPVVRSYRSAMPEGGVKVVATAVPKKPTSIVLATVVVIEGAPTVVELVLASPPEALIGADVSTPP